MAYRVFYKFKRTQLGKDHVEKGVRTVKCETEEEILPIIKASHKRQNSRDFEILSANPTVYPPAPAQEAKADPGLREKLASQETTIAKLTAKLEALEAAEKARFEAEAKAGQAASKAENAKTAAEPEPKQAAKPAAKK